MYSKNCPLMYDDLAFEGRVFFLTLSHAYEFRQFISPLSPGDIYIIFTPDEPSVV